MKSTLSVKEFIEQTLLDVCEAVETARNKYDYIAPKVFTEHAEDTSNLISFDIAVTVAETESKETSNGANIGTKFGIAVVKVEAGLNDKKQEQTGLNVSTVSRIKLNIPVYFRYSEEKRAKKERDDAEFASKVNKVNSRSTW
jgi:hypothetical protein